MGGRCVRRLWCLPSSGLSEGRGGRCQSGPGLEPLASRGWLVLPKTAPLGGTLGVTALIWHVDEQGTTAFSLVLGEKKT